MSGIKTLGLRALSITSNALWVGKMDAKFPVCYHRIYYY